MIEVENARTSGGHGKAWEEIHKAGPKLNWRFTAVLGYCVGFWGLMWWVLG